MRKSLGIIVFGVTIGLALYQIPSWVGRYRLENINE